MEDSQYSQLARPVEPLLGGKSSRLPHTMTQRMRTRLASRPRLPPPTVCYSRLGPFVLGDYVRLGSEIVSRGYCPRLLLP